MEETTLLQEMFGLLTQFRLTANTADRWTWRWEKSGCFSVKSAYHMLIDGGWNPRGGSPTPFFFFFLHVSPFLFSVFFLSHALLCRISLVSERTSHTLCPHHPSAQADPYLQLAEQGPRAPAARITPVHRQDPRQQPTHATLCTPPGVCASPNASPATPPSSRRECEGSAPRALVHAIRQDASNPAASLWPLPCPHPSANSCARAVPPHHLPRDSLRLLPPPCRLSGPGFRDFPQGRTSGQASGCFGPFPASLALHVIAPKRGGHATTEVRQ
ncbi:hypothetical protein Taro_050477 [Colocasia esculenta]|uniref:Uncharacterized protein n=1 Tax=Colocasia esculenta TaxID=4460 RepID=A0A843XE98_COLES|nr:hypothetical protein [Colocasia esculenta]